MQKFTTVLKNTKPEEKPEPLYQGTSIEVQKYKNWEITKEKNMIIVLPFFIDEGYILLRSEYIPTYQWSYREQYKNIQNFITVISGGVEEKETPIQAIKRELYEEAGIVLSSFHEIEIDKPLHVSKGSFTQYYPCLMELKFNDLKQVKGIGDGSVEEMLSKTIRVSIGDLDQIRCSDLITEYMLLKLKKEYNLK